MLRTIKKYNLETCIEPLVDPKEAKNMMYIEKWIPKGKSSAVIGAVDHKQFRFEY